VPNTRSWSIYGAKRAQPVATDGKLRPSDNRSNKPFRNRRQPTAAVQDRMVRRGSTVRVRQRAFPTRSPPRGCLSWGDERDAQFACRRCHTRFGQSSRSSLCPTGWRTSVSSVTVLRPAHRVHRRESRGLVHAAGWPPLCAVRGLEVAESAQPGGRDRRRRLDLAFSARSPVAGMSGSATYARAST
jgi:hypothetical protein